MKSYEKLLKVCLNSIVWSARKLYENSSCSEVRFSNRPSGDNEKLHYERNDNADHLKILEKLSKILGESNLEDIIFNDKLPEQYTENTVEPPETFQTHMGESDHKDMVHMDMDHMEMEQDLSFDSKIKFRASRSSCREPENSLYSGESGQT